MNEDTNGASGKYVLTNVAMLKTNILNKIGALLPLLLLFGRTKTNYLL